MMARVGVAHMLLTKKEKENNLESHKKTKPLDSQKNVSVSMLTDILGRFETWIKII